MFSDKDKLVYLFMPSNYTRVVCSECIIKTVYTFGRYAVLNILIGVILNCVLKWYLFNAYHHLESIISTEIFSMYMVNLLSMMYTINYYNNNIST